MPTDIEDQDQADPGRIEKRTCAWCGEWMTYSGHGPMPTYCSKAHRNRAWEVRSAERRLGRDLAAGRAATGPVRELARPPAPPAPKAPTRVADWVKMLGELEQQLGEGGELRAKYWDHQRLSNALWDAMEALNQATPGGMTALLKNRR
jgi:hypothetical protein